MNRSNISHKTILIVVSAVLAAFGIIISMFVPKFHIIPGIMTITIGSHLPIILAMFISPLAAVFVTLVTSIGFLITTTPVVAIRALSHLSFALGLSFISKSMLKNTPRVILLCIMIALVHAIAETLSVLLCTLILKDYFVNVELNYYYFFVAIGLVVFAHSIIDFILAYLVYIPLKRNRLLNF